MEKLKRRRDHEVLLKGRTEAERGVYPHVYEFSVVRRMFGEQLQIDHQSEVFATFTDIDDSLTGVGQDQTAQRIIAQEHASNRPIITVTGNHFRWMQQRIAQGEYFLQLPVMATSAGTEIWVQQEDGSYMRDEEYNAALENLGYDRRELTVDALRFIEQTRNTHPEWNLKFRHPGTDRGFLDGKDMSQDAEFEPKKITFRFAPTDPYFSLDECIKELVTSSPAIQNQIVVGCRVPHSTPLFDIDIVPTTKGGALLYLTAFFEQMTGCKLHAVVSGDSGNDIDMLRTALYGHPSIAGKYIPALLDGYKPEADVFAQELHALARGRTSAFVRHADNYGRTDRLAYVGQQTGSGPKSLLRILQTLRRKQNFSS